MPKACPWTLQDPGPSSLCGLWPLDLLRPQGKGLVTPVTTLVWTLWHLPCVTPSYQGSRSSLAICMLDTGSPGPSHTQEV